MRFVVPYYSHDVHHSLGQVFEFRLLLECLDYTQLVHLHVRQLTSDHHRPHSQLPLVLNVCQVVGNQFEVCLYFNRIGQDILQLFAPELLDRCLYLLSRLELFLNDENLVLLLHISHTLDHLLVVAFESLGALMQVLVVDFFHF